MNQRPAAQYPVDAAGPARQIEVSYPAVAEAGSPCHGILARGNVPLLIGGSLLAEVPRRQLDAEWRDSSTLSDMQAADCCRRAAARLSRAFDTGLDAADLADVVADAAVLFVLTLRKAGIASAGELRPCSVEYDRSGRACRLRAAG